jgi:hypothetical protein
MTEENNKDLTEKPEEIIDEITSTLDDIHDDLVDSSTKVGHEIERFKAIRPVWAHLGESTTTDPDVAQIYSSGVDTLSSIRDEVKSLRSHVAPLSNFIGVVSTTTDLAISVTSSTGSFSEPSITNFIPLNDPLLPRPPRHSETKRRLAKLDPALADTYEGIWETLYGTRSDPERGSLYLIRQAYDHLFGILAPDDKVRASPYWHEKKDDRDPKRVTRMERIKFAAYTRIRDQSKAKRLAAGAKHMLDVYKALNRAHQRGPLDLTTARNALRQMQTIIEHWVEALDL